MDRDEELRALIKEQRDDMTYGNRVWHEFRGMSSLEAMADKGLDIDDQGQVPRRTMFLIRNAPVRTKGRRGGYRGPPKEPCSIHPGEEVTIPSGRTYCRGCQRDKNRARLGYTNVKRRKVDGPKYTAEERRIRTRDAKRRYRAENGAKLREYHREWRAKRKAQSTDTDPTHRGDD